MYNVIYIGYEISKESIMRRMQMKKNILNVGLCVVFFALTSIGCGNKTDGIPVNGEGIEFTISPENTDTDILQPTATLIPQETATPVPTATNTPTPTVTNTPTPTVTNTPTPTPTNTPAPTPTNTPVPTPTSTPSPKLTFTYKDMSNKDMWTTTNVNLRTLPSTEGEKILVVSKDHKVAVNGQCNETGWYKVTYDGKNGYICNDYLTDKNPTITPTPIVVVSDLVKAALLIECESNEVLYAYQEKEQITPASITKLMTALLALEKGNMEESVAVKESAFDLVFPDATKCGLKLGDSLTLGNLLYGLLLPSGNDAAVVVGECISGDVNSFVSLMNQRAAELGMVSTNFGNPHGLPCDGHLTSAWDISLLMKELLGHEAFFEIANHDKFEVTCLDKNGNEKTLEMKNTNLYYQGKKALPEGIVLLGGKTGYTDLAGHCLVLYVKNEEGDLYIAEIFGAKGKDNLYAAMNRLLEYIMDND